MGSEGSPRTLWLKEKPQFSWLFLKRIPVNAALGSVRSCCGGIACMAGEGWVPLQWCDGPANSLIFEFGGELDDINRQN